MKIISHDTKKVGSTGLCLYHTVRVEPEIPPDPELVADECGYTPLGYDMASPVVEPLSEGLYQVHWYSSPDLL